LLPALPDRWEAPGRPFALAAAPRRLAPHHRGDVGSASCGPGSLVNGRLRNDRLWTFVVRRMRTLQGLARALVNSNTWSAQRTLQDRDEQHRGGRLVRSCRVRCADHESPCTLDTRVGTMRGPWGRSSSERWSLLRVPRRSGWAPAALRR